MIYLLPFELFSFRLPTAFGYFTGLIGVSSQADSYLQRRKYKVNESTPGTLLMIKLKGYTELPRAANQVNLNRKG